MADGGESRTFGEKEEFIESFFQARSDSVGNFEPQKGKQYYILARIQLNHVKLDPPLNLITLFNSLGIATGWKEIPLPLVGGEG
jgi:hypothetical protein